MIRILQGTISYPEVKWGKAEERAARNTPLIKFVDDIAIVGADGIELWGRHLDGLGDGDIKALARKIGEIGQKVAVLSPYWDFSSSDEAVEASLDDAWRYLGLTDVFGAKMIRVFAGAPGSAEAKQENWDRAIDGLTRLARMYDDSGVLFVIETHGDQLPDTVESSLRLVKEVGEPTIRLNYQSMKGKPAEQIEALYPYIRHVHVSPVARFADSVEEMMKELVKRGYEGAVTVEFCTDSLPAEGVEFDRGKAIAGMKKDVARLKALRS